MAEAVAPEAPSASTLLLIDHEANQHLVDLKKQRQELPGVGRFSTTLLEGKGPGDTVDLAGRPFTVLAPSLSDILAGLKRGPQWVSLKDGSWLIGACGLGAGDVVAEAGSGTGALTVQLAHTVAPEGKVVSVDNRPEHLKVARANLKQTGLNDMVEFHDGDVAQGFPVPSTDGEFPGFRAIFLDLPQPWEVLGAASKALRPGGWLAVYVPTANQLDRTLSALDGFTGKGGSEAGAENGPKTGPEIRGTGWGRPQVVENLQREWQARAGALRPMTRMLGHTGFCLTVRWLGPKMY